MDKKITEKKKLDTAVQKELSRAIKEDPTSMILGFLVIMGKMCVESNAATMDLKTESTLNKKRYEVKCKISVKEIKMPKYKPSTNE